MLLSLLSLGVCRSLCVSEGGSIFACVPGHQQPSFSLVVIAVQNEENPDRHTQFLILRIDTCENWRH